MTKTNDELYDAIMEVKTETATANATVSGEVVKIAERLNGHMKADEKAFGLIIWVVSLGIPIVTTVLIAVVNWFMRKP